MNAAIHTYNFPELNNLIALECEAPQETATYRSETAFREAAERGYEQGLAEGRLAARAELEAAAKQATREAAEAGRAEGLAEAKRAVEALRALLAQVESERQTAVQQLESFGVELALAALLRITEVGAVRADFVRRMIAEALKVLAPEQPRAIYLNPTDRKQLGRSLAGLPVKSNEALAPGSARVEAGRLFVEGTMEQALDRIRHTVMEVRVRRTRKTKKQ